MALRLSILVDSKADTTGFKEADTGMKALNNNLKTLQAGFGAVVGAAATFKQAFDMSREGASVLQLRTSFERMNTEVYKTPGLLDAMKEATRGTVGEGTLMASMLTLTAGASEQVSQAMAAAAPQLAEIAKAASALNPTLGDTSMMFDSLGLGIKRQSPMILDNLGLTIRIGEANEAMAAKLGKSVESLTAEEKQMALLNEVMRAGDVLIQQAGGSVDASTDAWDRLTVRINEGTTSLKTWLAEGLQPVIAALADDYGNEVDDIVAKNIEQAVTVEDLKEQYANLEEGLKMYGGLGALVTGTQDDLRDGQMAIIEQLALSSDSANEFISTLLSMGVEMDKVGAETSAYYIEIYKEAVAHKENEAAIARENERRAASREHIANSATATKNYEETLRAVNRVLVEHGVSLNATTVPADELYYTTTDLVDATHDFSGALGETLPNIQAVQQALAGDFSAALTSTSDGTVNWTNELFNQATQMGLNQAQMVLFAEATGLYSQEQINAALQTALMKQKVDELAAAVSAGDMTVDEAVSSLQAFKSELDSNVGATQRFIDKLHEIPSRIPVEIIVSGEVPTAGGGYQAPSDAGGGSGGNITQYASGTSYHPGGLALIGEHGPELVSLPRGSSVATASETRSMMGGQTVIQVGPIYALSPAMANPRVLGAEIARNIGSKMIGG